MAEVVIILWALSGVVAWWMTLSQMQRSWRKSLGRDRPLDVSDFAMLVPCVIIGPIALIISIVSPFDA